MALSCARTPRVIVVPQSPPGMTHGDLVTSATCRPSVGVRDVDEIPGGGMAQGAIDQWRAAASGPQSFEVQSAVDELCESRGATQTASS